MGFLDPLSDHRYILPTETDANSPLSEELMSQYRENIEANIMDTKYVGKRFSIVSIDSDTQLTVEKVHVDDPDWVAGSLILLISTMRTGNAVGTNYTIAGNTELSATSLTATLTFSSSTLLSDGLLAGDEGLIMYTLTGAAHTHNGIDSAPLGAIDQFSKNKDSVSGGTNHLVDTVYTTAAAIRVWCKLYTRSLVYLGSSTLSGATLRMVLPAQVVHYTDALTGDYLTYTIPTSIYGEYLTLGTIPAGLATIGITMDQNIHSINVIEAGVPLGAPAPMILEVIVFGSGSLVCDFDVAWFSSPA